MAKASCEGNFKQTQVGCSGGASLLASPFAGWSRARGRLQVRPARLVLLWHRRGRKRAGFWSPGGKHPCAPCCCSIHVAGEQGGGSRHCHLPPAATARPPGPPYGCSRWDLSPKSKRTGCTPRAQLCVTFCSIQHPAGGWTGGSHQLSSPRVPIFALSDPFGALKHLEGWQKACTHPAGWHGAAACARGEGTASPSPAQPAPRRTPKSHCREAGKKKKIHILP